LYAKLTIFSDSPKEMLKKNNSCLLFLRERADGRGLREEG
jgi:hypothetical protein